MRLIRTENVGPIAFFRLLSRCGSVEAALEEAPRLARRSGRASFKLCSEKDAASETAQGEAEGGRLVAFPEPDYPALLRVIPDPPPLLWMMGAPELGGRPCAALVGARNASAVGLTLASRIAQELGEEGVTVVSGLARGVDAAAHSAALETGTIAVLAGGPDVLYPPENAALHRAVRENGLIVSERRWSAQPTGRDFPRRNRIIAGLSHAVGVIEAAARSGSLITARLAAEQGRDVLAAPGSPLDPRSAGCNRLIRDGALLLETADDLLAVLRGEATRRLRSDDSFHDLFAWADAAESRSVDDAETDAARETIRGLLSTTPVHPDALARASGLSAAAVSCALVELSLAGEAVFDVGGTVRAAITVEDDQPPF